MARKSKGTKFANKVWGLAADMGIEREYDVQADLQKCANLVWDGEKSASAAVKFRSMAAKYSYRRGHSVLPATFRKCAKLVAPKAYRRK